MLSFSNIFEGINDVLAWVGSVVDDINRIFYDVDFSVLYSWLPRDVSSVCASLIVLLLFLALIGLLKKAILFLG